MQDKIIPFKKCAAIILISMFCVGSIAGGGLFFFQHLKIKHMHHEKFTIAAIPLQLLHKHVPGMSA
jgi:hypothetical protein